MQDVGDICWLLDDGGREWGGRGARHAGIRMQDDDDVMEMLGWRYSK